MSAVLNRLERKAVTIQEAAELLAVSPLTIRRAIKTGKLKAARFSAAGSYRIAIAELDRFLLSYDGKENEEG